MDIIKIVAIGLESHGYSGLVVGGECGCTLDDLSPACCLSGSCVPGYKHTHSHRPADWIISVKQDGVTDADIESYIAFCV